MMMIICTVKLVWRPYLICPLLEWSYEERLMVGVLSGYNCVLILLIHFCFVLYTNDFMLPRSEEYQKYEWSYQGRNMVKEYSLQAALKEKENITKTRLYKYIENFTTKNLKVFR